MSVPCFIATTSTKRAQDHEEDDTPVTLGFGIPAPPPSYTAAISKKNAGTFLVSRTVSC